ncbi:ribosomal protein L6, alpha-beta domain-containing protein [Sporodiniella umbellata]|nr:ribosomal protein L6, alpha-beta domain-containing protein [Sporodiniella umbellata]
MSLTRLSFSQNLVLRNAPTKRLFHSFSPVLSHIGRKPIAYAQDITIEHDLTPILDPRIPSELNNTMLNITGPLGKQQLPIKPFVKLQFTAATKDSPNAENLLEISVEDKEIKKQRSMWGTTRALINNAIIGVSDGYKVHLRLVGVGYRGALENNNKTLALKLGYSHPVLMEIPEGLTCAVPQPNRVLVSGIDLQQVTEFAAKIQRWRKPEPYNQKGIFINDETIKKKEGKKK